MKTLNVTIELDPVNDGAVFAENRFKNKEEGALIIGTNGEKRIAGASEAQRILDMHLSLRLIPIRLISIITSSSIPQISPGPRSSEISFYHPWWSGI